MTQSRRRFQIIVEEAPLRRHREGDPEPDAMKRLRLLLKDLRALGLRAVGVPVEITPQSQEAEHERPAET